MWYIISLLVSAIIVPAIISALQTRNTVWPDYKTFYPIKKDIIQFDVWSGHDAWIAFFEEPYPTAPKYEVLLGGFDNTVVEILCNRTILMKKLMKEVLDIYNYRSFEIKLENRIKTPDFKLAVFQAKESVPFISVIENEHIDINYFAVATTGAGKNGYWKLKDIDEGYYSVHHVDTNVTYVLTSDTSFYDNPNYTTFYRITDNLMRFRVRTSNRAWIRLTPTKADFPNYEVMISTGPGDGYNLYINHTRVSYDSSLALQKNMQDGFWIDFGVTSDAYGSRVNIICVGHEDSINNVIRYVDTSPSFVAKYFSIATTSKNKGDIGYWQLLNLWPQ